MPQNEAFSVRVTVFSGAGSGAADALPGPRYAAYAMYIMELISDRVLFFK